MLILRGRDCEELDAVRFRALAASYDGVCADVGTGDGKRLYREAARHPRVLYAGVDPVRANMAETARRASRKPEKGGLSNLLLIPGAVEALPEELSGAASEVTVFLPWGTLLEAVARPVPGALRNLAGIAVPGAAFEFLLTYTEAREGAEMARRGLPELSGAYFRGPYRDALRSLGFALAGVEELDNRAVREVCASKWAKKLASGPRRTFYRLTGTIEETLIKSVCGG